jgi:hypothetical protein
LLDVFAQSKDDVEMWVDALGRSLSSPPKLSLNDPNGNAPKHHGRKNPFSLWRSDTECATAGQAAAEVAWPLGRLAAWPLVGFVDASPRRFISRSHKIQHPPHHLV